MKILHQINNILHETQKTVNQTFRILHQIIKMLHQTQKIYTKLLKLYTKENFTTNILFLEIFYTKLIALLGFRSIEYDFF